MCKPFTVGDAPEGSNSITKQHMHAAEATARTLGWHLPPALAHGSNTERAETALTNASCYVLLKAS